LRTIKTRRWPVVNFFQYGTHPRLDNGIEVMPTIKTVRIGPLLIGVAVSVCIFSGCASIPATQTTTRDEKEKAMVENLVRRRVENWAKAVRARDIDGVLSLYATNNVSFDVDPPLRYAGAANKRQAWQKFFAARTGPITYQVFELNVTALGELAFVHSLNHVSSTLLDGHKSDLWVRWTACFQRIDGVWLVVHDHVSVPANLKSGQAVVNLTP
jgi:ketosteroid isomerase-like protein